MNCVPAGVPDVLLAVLRAHLSVPLVVQPATQLLSAVITPDDPKAQLSKAFEIAKIIGSNGTMDALQSAMSSYVDDPRPLVPVLNLTRQLAMNQDVCEVRTDNNRAVPDFTPSSFFRTSQQPPHPHVRPRVRPHICPHVRWLCAVIRHVAVGLRVIGRARYSAKYP